MKEISTEENLIEENINKNQINIDKIVYIAILIIMIGIPLLKFITYVPFILKFDPYVITRSRVYFFWGSIIFMLLFYLYGIVSGEKKINYIDYLFYFLIFSLFISTTFSVGFKKSFYGADTRYDGLLTILNYYLIALNAKNLEEKKYKENILKCFIGIGVFQSLYSILQALTPFTFWNRKFSGGAYMAMGLCSNPNFFGAYMAMQLSLVTVYYLSKGKWKYLGVFALFSMALYLAGSSGPLLGYILSFVLIGIIFRKYFKRVTTLIITFLVVCYCTDSSLKFVHQDLLKTQLDSGYVISTELAQTVDKIGQDNIKGIGNGRVNLWLNSLPLLKKYWLTGCGLDNFGDVYPQSGNVYYDKAHNVYLHMGITNGLIPLIVYMFICLTAFIKGFKLKKTYSLSVFMCFVSYCILAFANISAIDVAPYFFIMLGILLSEVNHIKILNKK